MHKPNILKLFCVITYAGFLGYIGWQPPSISIFAVEYEVLPSQPDPQRTFGFLPGTKILYKLQVKFGFLLQRLEVCRR